MMRKPKNIEKKWVTGLVLVLFSFLYYYIYAVALAAGFAGKDSWQGLVMSKIMTVHQSITSIILFWIISLAILAVLTLFIMGKIRK
jgi:hypothetical protein